MLNNVLGTLKENLFVGDPAPSDQQQQQQQQHPEDIPREELMQLCMKMNTRMKTIESKYKDLSRKRTTLQNERSALVQCLERILQSPLTTTQGAAIDNFMSSPGGTTGTTTEPDLDLASLQQKVSYYEEARRQMKAEMDIRQRHYDKNLMEAQNRNTLLCSMLKNGSNKSNDDAQQPTDNDRSSNTVKSVTVAAVDDPESTMTMVELSANLQNQVIQTCVCICNTCG
jgi:hypothetical protein